MLGCRRCHLRLNAPVQELEDHFTRYREQPCDGTMLFLRSTCTHSSVGSVVVAFPTPTKSIRFPRPRGFNLSHSKRRCQDSEQSAAVYVACTMRRLPQGMGTFLLTRLEPYQLFVCRERSECLRHLHSTLTEQSNSEDAFLSLSIIRARVSALSLPTESVSPGA